MDKANLPSMVPLDHTEETKNIRRSTGVKESGNAPVAQWIEQRTSNP